MKSTAPPHTIPPDTDFLDQKKNEFLAALYENDVQAAQRIYQEIAVHALGLCRLSEISEKRLNQIQTIYKRFLPVLSKQDAFGIRNTHDRVKALLLNTVRQSSQRMDHVTFLAWKSRLGLRLCQENLLFRTAMTFQLTSGCSNYCRRCNEWALPGVRSHFSYDAILEILNTMAAQQNKEISLYGASDPLDWAQADKTISDIIDLLDTLPIEYSLLTKVPKGKTQVLKALLAKHANLSVSITSKNKARINAIEQTLEADISKQHDLDDLLIPAGLDEDFLSIKPSITDGYGTEITPDGAFIIIPTFTSALHPFGHKKIPVTRETDFFPVKKTGRTALLVDYFKPLQGYDLDGNKAHLPGLLDVQVESILLDNGTDQLTPPGMRSLKEYLSIFERPARLQRKKMTLSVVKRLKKQFLCRGRFKQLPAHSRDTYLKKINHHLDLCQEKKCVQAKLHAVSFFLTEVHHYQQRHPEKLKIVQFLLKDEISNSFKTHGDQEKSHTPQTWLSDPDLDAFGLFRFYLFSLLSPVKRQPVLDFILAYASAYDPLTDIFVPV